MAYTNLYFKYCPEGHLVWSLDGIVQQVHCSKCGGALLEKCEHCEAEIPNLFSTRIMRTVGKPMTFPTRPKFCRGCGSAYPWTEQEQQRINETGIWDLFHPKVIALAKPRFNGGHYADAVESVFKQINRDIKELYRPTAEKELDGVALMRKVFSPANPVLVLGDLETETGRNLQQGYLDIFAGSMAAIRNPKAHDNLVISAERAIHLLTLGSLLFHKLDETK